eukprot:scaffold4736_cov434-Prasinococcus_capsulatus_cf.AAC.2
MPGADQCIGQLNLDITDLPSTSEEGDHWYSVDGPPKRQEVLCSFYFGSPAKRRVTKPTKSTSHSAYWKAEQKASFACALTTYEDMFNFTVQSKQACSSDKKVLGCASLKLLWSEDTNGVVYSYAGADGIPVTVAVPPGGGVTDIWLPLQQSAYSHIFSGRLHLRVDTTWFDTMSRLATFRERYDRVVTGVRETTDQILGMASRSHSDIIRPLTNCCPGIGNSRTPERAKELLSMPQKQREGVERSHVGSKSARAPAADKSSKTNHTQGCLSCLG